MTLVLLMMKPKNKIPLPPAWLEPGYTGYKKNTIAPGRILDKTSLDEFSKETINFKKFQHLIYGQKKAAIKGKEGRDLCDKFFEVFSISCITPYTKESILKFMKLSGLDIDETRILLKEYSRLGINNLRDVNLLLMLGHVKYDK